MPHELMLNTRKKLCALESKIAFLPFDEKALYVDCCPLPDFTAILAKKGSILCRLQAEAG
jgi:hypothetical protein